MIHILCPLQDIFESVAQVHPNIHGLLSVEYNGKPAKIHDGICLTILVSVVSSGRQAPVVNNKENYDWHIINSKELSLAIKRRQTRCIPLLAT